MSHPISSTHKPLLTPSSHERLEVQHLSTKSQTPFHFGTFTIDAYTLQLSFDFIKGFQAHLATSHQTLDNVDLTPPFAIPPNIPREHLFKLSCILHTEYAVRVVRMRGGHLRVEFTPQLRGGATEQPDLTKLMEEKKEEKKEFKEHKDHSPRNTSPRQPIRNTQELSVALQNTDPQSTTYAELEQLALNIINTYAQHIVKTPALLKELTALVSSGNPRISQEILKVLFKELHSAPFLDIEILGALRDTIRTTNKKHLDPDNLVSIFKTLKAKYESFHAQSTTNPKLYQLLYTFSGLLDAMGDVNVEQLSYDAQHDPLYRILDDLVAHEDWHISVQASYAKEALLRIGHDKTKFMLYFGQLTSLGKGVGNLKDAFFEKSLGSLLEAFTNFKEALHSQGKKHGWYEELRFISILISGEKFIAFEEHLPKILNTTPEKERPFLLMGIVNALVDMVSNHSNLKIQTNLLNLLSSLYLDDKKWGSISKLWTTLKVDSDEKIITKVKVGLLIQFKIWAGEESLSKAAKEALEAIQKSAKTPLQQKWLEKAKIPKDLSSIVAITKPFKRPEELLAELFQETQEKQKGIPDILRKIQTYYVRENADINTLLATYIASSGSLSSTFDDPFPLERTVLNFLKGHKKVLLLLGGSGAGKTSFGKNLTYNLWREWTPNQLIPIFIPLNSKKGVEESLLQLGFSSSQVQQMKKTNSFIFILDGYDEMGEKPNLYQKYRLDQWNCKVIISCRPQYISGEDPQSLFAPQNEDYIPQSDLLEELYITPFSDKEIEAYLRKYLSVTPAARWKDPPKYQEYIEKIPGLRTLVSTPFLLFITADVLPDIVERQSKEKKIELLQRDLYDAFTTKWFVRSEGRLRAAERIPPSEKDIKKNFLSYCKKLAAKMREKNITAVKYTIPLWDEGPNEWEKFFGDQGILPLLREGSPIQKIGQDEYAFLHKSLLEYFIFRESFDQMIGTIPSVQPKTSREESKSRDEIKENNLALVPEIEAPKLDMLPPNFTTRLLVDESAILNFFAETVRMNSAFKTILFSLIEQSKKDPAFAIGAANSITILNAAKVPFSRLDFADIRIPGAYLEGAIFDGTNLRGADLKNTVLVNAFLRESVLKQAQMEGVRFGQRSYLMHPDSVHCVAISPNGKWLVSGSGNSLHLWDLKFGKTLKCFEGHMEQVTSCAFSPGGKWLVSGSYDDTLRLWDLESGKTLKLFKGLTYYVSSCAFSPDGKRLVSGGGNKNLRLWDLESGKTIKRFEGHTRGVTSCAFSPDRKWLVSGSDDNSLRLWDLESGETLKLFEGHTGGVTSCAFSPDGKWLASGSWDKSLRFWDLKSGNPLKCFEGHTDRVTSCAFSPDGKWLASGSDDKSLRLWDLESGKALKLFEGHTLQVNACAFSPDGGWLVSGSVDKTVRLWDLRVEQRLDFSDRHTDRINSCAFSPNGKWLASGSSDDTLRLWDVESGKALKLFTGHTSWIRSCAFSPDGRWLASGSSDNTLRLWDLESGKTLKLFEGHTMDVKSCTFSPDSKWLISGSTDNTLRLWDLETGKTLKLFEGHELQVNSCAFSPDGRWLASGSGDGTLRLWDFESGKTLKLFEGHTERIYSCAFSPNGKRLASGSEDGSLRLWDLESGKTLKLFEGHTWRVTSCAFSLDGKWLVSGSRDNTLRFWDLESEKTITLFEEHTDWVTSCAFSPDGTRLASTSKNKSVRLWSLFDKNHQLDPRLTWTSTPLLAAPGAELEGAKGLSDLNRQLLEQCGAKTDLKTEQKEEKKK